MTDRPTIFADPIVRVLLDGGKPQAYRLALSPLASVFLRLSAHAFQLG